MFRENFFGFGLSKKDQAMMNTPEEKPSTLSEKIKRSEKVVIPAAILATMLSGANSEAAKDSPEIHFLKMKSQYRAKLKSNLIERIAPQYIETKEDGSREIPKDVLVEQMGNFVINDHNISVNKSGSWAEIMKQDESVFYKKIDSIARDNPALSSLIKDEIKSLYKKMFPNGFSSPSCITTERTRGDGSKKLVNLPASYASAEDASKFVTDETAPIIDKLSGLSTENRDKIANAVNDHEADMINLAVRNECERLENNE